LFRYEDEVIDTDIDEIDNTVEIESNIQTLTLVSSGSTATATTSIANGAVVSIIVTNRGEKYTSSPIVAISSSPSSGGTATAVSTLIDGIVNCDGTEIGSRVQTVQITNPGYGYTTNPGIVFIGGGGSGAIATTRISNQAIGIITITSGGSGYTTSPSITFSSPGIGTTATAISIVSSAGTISGIRIVNAGAGYTSQPSIIIGSPYMIGIGTFINTEIIVGSISSTSAIVKSWNAIIGELNISNLTGEFVIGENIVGSESNASYQLKTIQNFNTINKYSQNDEIENESDDILDFSESNPFGDP
jgi:hypothetical protein